MKRSHLVVLAATAKLSPNFTSHRIWALIVLFLLIPFRAYSSVHFGRTTVATQAPVVVTVEWDNQFADTNYTAVCTGSSLPGHPEVTVTAEINSKATDSLSVVLRLDTEGTGLGSGPYEVNCLAVENDDPAIGHGRASVATQEPVLVTVPWDTPFADTDYTAVCTGSSLPGHPEVTVTAEINSKSTNFLSAVLRLDTTDTGLGSGPYEVDCLGVENSDPVIGHGRASVATQVPVVVSVPWDTPFGNTNYTAACTGSSLPGHPEVTVTAEINSKSKDSLSAVLRLDTVDTGLGYGPYNIDCIAVRTCSVGDVSLSRGDQEGNYWRSIAATFTPEHNLTLAEAATECGFKGFDWLQRVTNLPGPSPFFAQDASQVPPGNISADGTVIAPPAINDPAPGGWSYLPGYDPYPFYYPVQYLLLQEQNPANDCIDQPPSAYCRQRVSADGKTLSFFDRPSDPCLPGGLAESQAKWCGGASVPPGPLSYLGFRTALVGINEDGSASPPLFQWTWTDTFNGTSGGIPRISNDLPVDPGSGTGGITITSINGVPLSPLVTTAVLSPPPNPNGWNNSNVTITLNSIQNEPGAPGVKQIQWSLTGAQTGSDTVRGSTAVVTVFMEGISTLTFYATDNAGNQEAPNSLMIQVDNTVPSITGVRTPAPNPNGWNNKNVTVTFTCADSLSGLAPGSPPAPTVVSTQGAGQTVSGTCVDLAGNSATSMVGGINIDTTAPVITAGANPQTLWPPNRKMAKVRISGTMADNLSGVSPSTAAFAVKDSYQLLQPSGSVRLASNGTYSFTISLEARRVGKDRNGRLYTIVLSAQDNSGNLGTATTTVVVPHDRGKHRKEWGKGW